MRYVAIVLAIALAGVAGFLASSGAVVGKRAFADYHDSQPWVYLAAGGFYLFLACVCAVAAFWIITRARRG